jgi:hypothetical protein
MQAKLIPATQREERLRVIVIIAVQAKLFTLPFLLHGVRISKRRTAVSSQLHPLKKRINVRKSNSGPRKVKISRAHPLSLALAMDMHASKHYK